MTSRCFVLALSVGLAACASPEDASMPAAGADARSLADVVTRAASAESLAVPRVSLGEFRATRHEDGRFEIALLDAAEWETPPQVGTLRVSQQALWCPIRWSAGAADTVVLSADPATIGDSPGECGLPEAFPYTTLGVFCADVAITSRLGLELHTVQAEVTSVSPSVGYNGYTFGASGGLIGTDPTLFAGQTGAPVGVLGLFGHGDIAPSGASTSQWVFENAGGTFTYRGRVMAALPELRNGLDDDCDGEIDEGNFADGETCTDASECFSGYCDGGAGLCSSECPADTWGPDCTPCNCDDGVFCNGAETCDATLGCQAGTSPVLDDGVSCTVDSCDEVSDSIVSATSDVLCDDSNDCTADSCDLLGGCVNAPLSSGAECSSCTGGSCVCSAGACVNPPPTGFVRIEAGSFMMGSPSGELGRGFEPQHAVTLTRDFYLQSTEVTQSQWQSLMGNNPSHFAGCADCPVESVNWWEALAYANALSAAEGLAACYTLIGCGFVSPGTGMECTAVRVNAAGRDPYACAGYRLPTESEWEYAARAGTTTATYAGDLTSTDCGDATLLPIAWFCGNAASTAHAVAAKLPSVWGLYDMLGNMWEWTWDRSGTYPGQVTDPVGPTTGIFRLIRGGSWSDNAQRTRAAQRYNSSAGSRGRTVGFRPARTAP